MMEYNIGLKILLIYVFIVYFFLKISIIIYVCVIWCLGVVNIYRLYVGKGFEEVGWLINDIL